MICEPRPSRYERPLRADSLQFHIVLPSRRINNNTSICNNTLFLFARASQFCVSPLRYGHCAFSALRMNSIYCSRAGSVTLISTNKINNNVNNNNCLCKPQWSPRLSIHIRIMLIFSITGDINL